RAGWGFIDSGDERRDTLEAQSSLVQQTNSRKIFHPAHRPTARRLSISALKRIDETLFTSQPNFCGRTINSQLKPGFDFHCCRFLCFAVVWPSDE
ncbi:hypothetical protein M9458_033661, partial [Cirrhinus mrigala]